MALVVYKKSKESVGAFLRRFSRVVQQSNVLLRVRNMQYRSRLKTDRLAKLEALRRIKRRKEFNRLRKLGKIE